MKRQPTLRERALRLLARREHSRAELARKLRTYASPAEELETLLEDLSRRRLLSDERYAESRAHALSRKYGAARIAHELRARGLDKALAEQASGAARATEVERAREVWRRKFRVAPKTREERAKQMRFLRSRGFSFDAIRAVLGGPGED
ncbi:MAG: recombination regulator RecX [Betaproteobacteria bacterium]|nr:MAG: recombination regulator RecX [Betaproteobacteria bacterium]